MEHEYLFIINPSSGSGRCGREWIHVAQLLEAEGLRFRFRMSAFAGHIQEIIAEEARGGQRHFASFGGDGTISALANGAMMQTAVEPNQLTLAHYPFGTGNDWGRTFNIPNRPKPWAAMLKQNRVFAHDCGVVDLMINGSQQRRYFINIAGLAYDAHVVRAIDDMRASKSFIQGRLLYKYVILRELIGYQLPELSIVTDTEAIVRPMLNMAVGICRHNGDGMRPFKHADPQDGLLDIMLVDGAMPKVRVITDLSKLRSGHLEGHPYISMHRSATLKVEHLGQPSFVEADGDSIGETPAEFSVKHQALRVVIQNLPDEAVGRG